MSFFCYYKWLKNYSNYVNDLINKIVRNISFLYLNNDFDNMIDNIDTDKIFDKISLKK